MMIGPVFYRAMCLALLFLFVGCATPTLTFPPVTTSGIADSPFVIAGRFSVNVDGRGYVAPFVWHHAPEQDELLMNTPIGTTIARITRDARGVILDTAGKQWYASDVDTLTEQQLGWILPLANLVWWIRGYPAPDVPARVDAQGSLVQQGWTIQFFSDSAAPLPHPKRIDLSRENLKLRVIVQSYR